MTTATAPAKTTAPNNPPAKQQQQGGGLRQLKDWLEGPAFADAISKALPKHIKPDRFIRVALTATMKTPKLLQCTQESMFKCLLDLSQAGLEPDGRRAHLIPFENSKKINGSWVKVLEATLIIDYKGLAELVMRSGLVSSIHADVICENDVFEYDRGFITKHKIDFRLDRGPAYAAYAVVRFKDGTEKCEVIPKADIYKIRDRSPGWQAFQKGWAKSNPWNPAEAIIEYEMWKKTAFRRLSKWIPLSAEIRDVVDREDDDSEQLASSMTINTNVIEGTATNKSDAIADMLEQQLNQGDEPNNDDTAQSQDEPTQDSPEPQSPPAPQGEPTKTTEPVSEPPQEKPAEKPTLKGLLEMVAASTRVSELHDINAIGKAALTSEEFIKLGQALHEHSELIEQQRKSQSQGKLV
jgi:recombination protein RecT